MRQSGAFREDAPRFLSAVGVAAAFAWAVDLRVRDLSGFHVHGDSVHPLHDALRLVQDGMPVPGRGNLFSYGQLQQAVLVPIVLWADSLRQALWANAVLHATLVFPVAWVAGRLGGPLAAAIAALLTAWHPFLADIPHYGGYTYQAPLLAAWSALAMVELLTRPSPVALVGFSLFCAAGVLIHPYAVVVPLAALPLAPRLLRGQPAGAAVAAGLAFVLALAPMIDANLAGLDAGDSGLALGFVGARPPGFVAEAPVRAAVKAAACLGGPEAPGRVLGAGLLPLLTLLAATGRVPLVASRRRVLAALAVWAVLAALAVAATATWLGYVRPYHFLVVVPIEIAVAAAVAAALAREAAARLSRAISPAAPQRPAALAAAWVLLVAPAGAAAWRWTPLLAERLLDPLYTAGGLSCYLSTADPRPGGRSLWFVEHMLRAIVLDSGDSPRAVTTLAEDEAFSTGPVHIQVGSSMAFTVAQRLAGIPDALLDGTRGVGEAWPKAYVAAELTDETWRLWDAARPPDRLVPGAVAPRVLYEFRTQPRVVLRLLAFDDPWQASRWMARGCEVAGSVPLRIEPPVDPLYITWRRKAEWVYVSWGDLCTTGSETWWGEEPRPSGDPRG